MVHIGEKAFLQGRSVFHRMVAMFHSEMSQEYKDFVLSEFRKTDSTIRCVVCTVAFGMGIQVKDIDVVVHWGVSKSPLSYWQEVGRCARDGRNGESYLFAFSRSLDRRTVSENMIDIVNESIENQKCPRIQILKYLCAGNEPD